MKIRFANELILINLVTVFLAAAILLIPSNPLRIALGLPYIFFTPGYALMSALFPRKDQIDALERVAFSLGFSIAVVALMGLALNYTPWGITLLSTLISISAFIAVMSLVAWSCRRHLTENERFQVTLTIDIVSWRTQSRLDRVLTVTLLVTILVAMGVFIYTVIFPPVGERFTEFYILNMDNKAADYPRELMVGQEASVKVGIINHEHETISYHVEVTIDGAPALQTAPVALAHDEAWEQVIQFTPTQAGENQPVELLLFKNGDTTPYESPLRLWLNVKQA